MSFYFSYVENFSILPLDYIMRPLLSQTVYLLFRSLFWTIFFFTVLAFSLFVLGNINNWTDRTQFFLLRSVSFAGTIFALCAIIFIVYLIFVKRHEKRIPLVSIIFIAAVGLVSALFAIISTAILAISRGG